MSKYLRAIYELTDGGESATKTSKVADKLGVSDPSASEAVSKLQEKGLVCKADYKGFTLSPMGKNKGKKSLSLYNEVIDFLERKGVEDSQKEANAMIDNMSESTIKKIVGQ